ncbi:hypothetical protein [Mycolicibacterium chubuense]|uniref:hypothetical protein n=1 Tax=Mycolicibacterium chubuense TaxID=1800 RepID=UPI0005A27BFF|nr:hypothetical protein [Mycolicibacterium chubuense]
MNAAWVPGDESGLLFPAHPAALSDAGFTFLRRAFRCSGVLDADNDVVAIDRFEEVPGGSTGRKAALSVRYAWPQPSLPTELFVKFSRDFDDPVRDRGRTQMQSEVTFALLSRAQGFPIAVPSAQFADYHAASGTGILISERIPFGHNGIERHYPKCLDYQMPAPIEHYRVLVTALARLAGTHRAGRLPARLVDRFPVDLRGASVGEPAVRTPEQVARRVDRLAEFARAHPGLFPADVRSGEFLARLGAEAPALIAHEPGIWRHLAGAGDHIALCHWNANVDNAWFWRAPDGGLRCGLMDWGCVSQMNVAMAIWGALSAAESSLWEAHLDELLQLFCAEVRTAGGPALPEPELRRALVLYAALMGVTWLLDVPAVIRARVPGTGATTTRFDAPIRDDEGIRAPLQMLVNVLKLWHTENVGAALQAIG